MALVASVAVAQALNITSRRVEQLVKEGMPRAGRGRYDLGACLLWYVRYLQKALEARSPRTNTGAGGDASDFGDAKLRSARADAHLKELELSRQRGEVVEVEAAARLWDEAVTGMRAKLVASINATAVRCVGLETIAQAHVVLRSMVNDALQEVELVARSIESGTE